MGGSRSAVACVTRWHVRQLTDSGRGRRPQRQARALAVAWVACYPAAMVAAPDLELQLGSRGATRRLGRALASVLELGDLVVLEGDLGAGKTFLVRSIARGLGVPTSVRITSPTFDLIHELPGRLPIFHVDLYRLDDPESVLDLGLQERVGRDVVALIEWGDRFAQQLGGEGLWVTLGLAGAAAPSGRRCQLSGRGTRGKALLERLRAQLPASLADPGGLW